MSKQAFNRPYSENFPEWKVSCQLCNFFGLLIGKSTFGNIIVEITLKNKYCCSFLCSFFLSVINLKLLKLYDRDFITTKEWEKKVMKSDLMLDLKMTKYTLSYSDKQCLWIKQFFLFNFFLESKSVFQ